MGWYSPKTRRRAALVSTSCDCARVMPDVAEPPLFLELLLVFRRSANGGTGPLRVLAMITIGNSSPFAACIVISQTRASRVPDSSSASDSSDRRSTKPPSDASASRVS